MRHNWDRQIDRLPPPVAALARRGEAFFHFMARQGWLPIILVLVATVAVWGFVELADEVMGGDIQSFDDRLLAAVAGRYETLGGFWQEAGRDATALGGTLVIALMTSAVTLFLVLRRRWRAAAFVAFSVVGGLIVSLVLKEVIDRPRPDAFTQHSHVMTQSFPSGHSSNSAVAYLTMAILLAKIVRSHALKAYIFFVGLLIPVIVGFSRVLLGVHWPTDVLAGWLVGLAWALVVYAAATFLQRRRLLDAEGSMDDRAA